MGSPVNVRPSALVALSVAALLAGCSGTTTGVATAPSDVSPYTATTTATRTTTSTTTATPTSTAVPPAAYDQIRAAGVGGTDGDLSDMLDMACIMADGSFNNTKQQLVDVLQQMGSKLSDQQLGVVVTVALTYRCPEHSDKLGG